MFSVPRSTAVLQHPSSLEAARLPSGPFHLRPEPADGRARLCVVVGVRPCVRPEWARQAPTIADWRSEIAAATRSAIRSGVKPISSCSSAGLPCVT
jgi:hypothetical protein